VVFVCDNWSFIFKPPLKNYLETQTEAIVHSIQSLLSAIRSGSQSPGPINENVSSIITIVGSIISISRESLPTSVKAQGETILKELEGNCEKLTELQQSSENSGQYSRNVKQSMAR
jgi:protein SPA2